MNFVELQNISGQSTNVTKKGLCKFHNVPIAEGQDPYFVCIEKTYSMNDPQFEKAKEFLQYLEIYAPQISPHVYHTTTENVIYTEYIDCSTLRSYIEKLKLDLTNGHDRDAFRAVMSSVRTLLVTLQRLRLCHKDLHADNILICVHSMQSKVIDLDSMRHMDERPCDDFIRLFTYLKAVGRQSIRRANSDNMALVDEILAEEFSIDDPSNLYVHPGNNNNSDEMTASDEEIYMIN